VGHFLFRYPGVSVGDRMNLINSWDPIIQRFKDRLSKWKANLLSIGGRITLVSSVLGSLPIYYISLFRFPRKVNALLEGIRARFF
jgi:hypothetical protein